MTLSITKAVGFCLIPGVAEHYRRLANASGNWAHHGVAETIQVARNVFYMGAGVVVGGALGFGMATTPLALYCSVAVIVVGAGVAARSFSKLIVAAEIFQASFNSAQKKA